VTRYLAPRGVQARARGVCDDGDAPAPLAQTGRLRARVDGSPHDIVTLVVPGGASVEAQFDLVGVCASRLAGPGKRRGESRGLRGEERAVVTVQVVKT
jgi:hypothetical protein